MPREAAPVFFVDASLGGRIVPEALRAAGLAVVAHDERFAPGTPDDVWLRESGQRGWLVLTKDKRIRYRQTERHALREAGVGTFVFVGKDLTAAEIVQAYYRPCRGCSAWHARRRGRSLPP